jgi:hypothetical protein
MSTAHNNGKPATEAQEVKTVREQVEGMGVEQDMTNQTQISKQTPKEKELVSTHSLTSLTNKTCRGII